MQQPSNTHIGRQLGTYRIIRKLGAGGFAGVYLGKHIQTNWDAAIKILNINYPEDAFRQEADILWKLNHPHIVKILGYNIENGISYLIMEYAVKGSLRDLHPQGSRLAQHQILEYVKQIASALNYMHRQHLVHCDIKPPNFLVRANGEVLLSDFGIAIEEVTKSIRLMSVSASSETIFGTPSYIAPEQAQREKATPATDQYSLGIVVYEWLCGRPPFIGKDSYMICQAHINTPPPPFNDPRISAHLEYVVMRALAKNPKERFLSILDFAQALESAILNPQPVPPHQDPNKRVSMWASLPPSRPITSFTPLALGGGHTETTIPNTLSSSGTVAPPSQPKKLAKSKSSSGFDWDNVLEESEDRRFVFFGIFFDLLCVIPLLLWLHNPNWTINLPALDLPYGLSLSSLTTSFSFPDLTTNPSYLNWVIGLLLLAIVSRVLCAAASKRRVARPFAWLLTAYETLAIFGLVVYINNSFSVPLPVFIPIVAVIAWFLNNFLYVRTKN